MGDFNEIVDLSEKYGGAVRNEAQMERFRSTLEECNLGDLGYKGSKYTWLIIESLPISLRRGWTGQLQPRVGVKPSQMQLLKFSL